MLRTEDKIFIAIFCIIWILVLGFCLFVSKAFPFCEQQIFEKAKPFIIPLNSKIDDYWNQVPYRYFFAGQVETESCSSLKKCWNPYAELKTSREYGFGFAQITVTTRFNKFLEAKQRYRELKDWQWNNRFSVDYQFTFLVLEDKRLFMGIKNLFVDDINRWAGALVSYNAGIGTVLKRRALCKMTSGCDKMRWFGDGLEKIKLDKEDKMLYNRTLWERRNEYPKNIIFVKSKKYIGLFNNLNV